MDNATLGSVCAVVTSLEGGVVDVESRKVESGVDVGMDGIGLTELLD